MISDETQRAKIMPAICTQCGAQIEVDSSLDAAVCQHCGTAFIVEKAIKHYNIKYANIEHIDTININNTGNVSTALFFIDKYLERRNRRKAEKEKSKAEKERLRAEEAMRTNKYIPLIMICTVILFIAVFAFLGWASKNLLD